MSVLKEKCILLGLKDKRRGLGPMRILHVDWQLERLILIPIDQSKPHGFIKRNAKEIQSVLDANDGALKLQEYGDLDPRANLSDEDLARRYPAAKAEETSFPVKYRKKWRPIMARFKESVGQVLAGMISMHQALKKACSGTGIPVQAAYAPAYAFLASGQDLAAVLPRTTNLGKKGVPRAGDGKSRGRPRLPDADHPNEPVKKNFAPTQFHIEQMQEFHRMLVGAGVSVKDAHKRFLQTHFRKGWKKQNGIDLPVLMEDGQYPSLNQFRAHGPGGDPDEAAWRKHLSGFKFESDFRPLDGNGTPLTFQTGVLAEEDASSGDTYLVSVFNRLRTVGPCRVIPIVDSAVGYITGLYVGWSVNAEAVQLALLLSMSSKVDFCRRFGFEIDEDDWLAIQHLAYRIDRGEANCKDIRALLEALDSGCEIVQTGRSELKGTVEGTHPALHHHDHDGSTKGRMRERGEVDPASQAILNIYEFTRDVIRAVLYHNNRQLVPHLLTTEMKRDGVRPTRKAIMLWARRKGYERSTLAHPDKRITHLCLQMDAVVRRDGVYPILRRHHEQGDEIVLKKLRYLGKVVSDKGWLELVRRREKSFRIRVYYNPIDVRSIWYRDPDTGLQLLTLASKDPLLAQYGTFEDCLQDQANETPGNRDLEHEETQARSDMLAEKDAAQATARREKKLAALQNPAGAGSNRSAQGRRQNRRDELNATGPCPAPLGPEYRDEIPQKPDEEPAAARVPDNVVPLRPTYDPLDAWLNEGV